MAGVKRASSAGDMVRSLAVILIPLLLITLFFTRNPGDHPVEVVDWQPVLAQARDEAPYPVLAPVNLPPDWRAVRASWTRTGAADPAGNPSPRNRWQLGFLDPQDVYVGVYQGDAQVEAFVAEVTRKGALDGTSTVGDDTWARRVSSDDRTRALVLQNSKVTSIVVGDVSYAALEAFAATLRTG
ncbi:hypothetical protein JOE57_000907 [Microlunatus panaciterrae]|uniref:DUF4245 domain-containing protein n=1 Tax=Microlunatus panaciterrae TaxID=400768 RepID=A0ABS2RIE6_9ACTN|nr:hypothetical protein [Microlunatus panaciterrae]